MRNDNRTQGSSQGSQRGSSVERVEQKAQHTTERVADKAQAAVMNTREKVAGQLEVVARAIESAANTLEQSQQRGLAQRVRPYIQKAENASQRLRQKSPRELQQDVDRMAREKPAWFLGGAFLLGLLSARFLKSSEKGSVEYARV
jgi:uncharacterized membrane protein